MISKFFPSKPTPVTCNAYLNYERLPEELYSFKTAGT